MFPLEIRFNLTPKMSKIENFDFDVVFRQIVSSFFD